MSRLLIVDDEEVVLDSCTQVLAVDGTEIATASSGERGIQLVKEMAPDLVLVDLKMPGTSGLEVLKAIRDLDPAIVTVVITGYATVSSAVEAMKQGAYDFLPKPFTPDELRMITRRALEHRRLLLETMALRREKEMLREQFAAIVSHELKSPLSAVQQNLYALSEDLAGRMTEEEKVRLEGLQTRIGDLMSLIHSWLRLVSADIGKIGEGFRPVSISAVMARAVENVQVHAARKDVEITTVGTSTLPSVCGDEGTLTEALTNVMSNAVKYSRMGGKVQLRGEVATQEVVISVIDEGVGISSEDLPLIFGDFYVGRSRPEGEQSTGLGLAITRRIIEAHHGTIAAQSEPGKGSTFVVRLPVLSGQSR